MKILDKLKKEMNEINNEVLIVNSSSNKKIIDKLNTRISKEDDDLKNLIAELNSITTKLPPGPSLDRIRLALQELMDNGFQDLYHASLLCSGCMQELEESNYCLIEDPKLFQELLDYVAKFLIETRAFRRCYQRLLNVYFLYEAVNSKKSNKSIEQGTVNKEKLRQFLNKYQPYIKADYNPEWVTTLEAHSNVLSSNPCVDYGEDALNGNRASFDEMCKGLQISNFSWLIGQLVLSACDYAGKQPDDMFKGYIMSLISLLKEHPLYVNRGLVILLNRYVKCEDKSMHIGLREYAVQSWGNPWLNITKNSWQCTVEARDMVASWLKRHLLREFFSILSHDGTGNTRRLNFWELYCEEPQHMYFALSSAAYDDNNDRFKSFRKDAEGLCKKLDGGKTRDLHAFIMQFNGMDVIEFSLAKNSTYFYATQFGNRPYNLDNDRVEIGSPNKGGIGLKAGGDNPPFSVRRSHSDTGMGLSDKWEQKYAAVMTATSLAVQEFCRKYKCEYIAGSSGGYDWIMLPQALKMEQFMEHKINSQKEQYVYVAAVLQGWGFQPSYQKNGWYREGR